MSAMPSAFLPSAGAGGPCAGVVHAVDAGRLRLRLRLATDPGAEPVSARWVALPGWSPAAGDEVLVLGSAETGYFVPGPLASGGVAKGIEAEAAPVIAADPTPARLELPGGAAAELDPDSGTLRVRDAAGSVLFSYRSAEGTGSLRLEADEVELAATRGDLNLSAAGSVRARARRVDLAGETGFSAIVGNGREAAGSRLEMDRDATNLDTGELDARARRVRGRAERAEWTGACWKLGVERLVVTAQRLETRAETVVEDLGNAYRRVRDLTQLSTRRLRQLVDDTVQTRARRVLYRASEAFKVRGDKIHLG